MGMTSVFAQQLWNGLLTGMAYVLFGISLNLIFGVLGVINMAHGELYMLGALLLWVNTNLLHLEFFTSMLLSVVAVSCFAVVINRVAIKPLIKDPLTVMLATIALSIIISFGITVTFGSDSRVITTPFGGSLSVIGASIPVQSLVLFGLGILALLGVFLLFRTKIGKAIRSTAQDRVGAGLVGINTDWVYAFTMIIASGLAALVGGILGPIWIVYPTMGQDMLLKGFAVVIASGMGNLKACVIVGLVLGFTEALFSQYVSMYFKDAYIFGLMVMVCLLRPHGLFSKK
jgi:branched-chain amino acid transport system permease protein